MGLRKLAQVNKIYSFINFRYTLFFQSIRCTAADCEWQSCTLPSLGVSKSQLFLHPYADYSEESPHYPDVIQVRTCSLSYAQTVHRIFLSWYLCQVRINLRCRCCTCVHMIAARAAQAAATATSLTPSTMQATLAQIQAAHRPLHTLACHSHDSHHGTCTCDAGAASAINTTAAGAAQAAATANSLDLSDQRRATDCSIKVKIPIMTQMRVLQVLRT